jgi:hypothetical protein
LVQGVSDESHLILEVGRINEIAMDQNRQERDTLGIRKDLNKFYVDWLERDQGIKVAGPVVTVKL